MSGAADPRLSAEERIYRREAIDFQRYRFVGEPLRLGKASLWPSCAALLALLACGLLLLGGRYVPAVDAKVASRDGLRLFLQADERGAARKLAGATQATLALSDEVRPMRIVRAAPAAGGARAPLVVEAIVEGLAGAPAAGPAAGAAVRILLPPRKVIEF